MEKILISRFQISLKDIDEELKGRQNWMFCMIYEIVVSMKKI